MHERVASRVEVVALRLRGQRTSRPFSRFPKRVNRSQRERFYLRWFALGAVLLVCSCRTIPPLPAVNLAEPGWTLHQGQALWQTKRDAPEIAGEIIFATHPSGRTMLQLTKNPLPFVTVQTRGDEWEVNFVPQNRRFSGRGVPTPRLPWVHLARALAGAKPPDSLTFTQVEPHGFTLENPKTGETISGFLNP